MSGPDPTTPSTTAATAAGTVAAPAPRRHPIVEVMSDRSYASFLTSSFLSSIIFGGARFAWVWVVLKSTGSAADAALAGGIALGLPNLLFSLPAGAYADRFNRRRMVMAASAFATAVLVVTSVLAGLDHLSLVAALATAFGLGMTVAVVQPVHTAMVPQLVPPELHLTGIALQNMSLQSSFFIGSLVTGALLDLSGPSTTFLVLAALQACSGLAMIPVVLRHPGDDDDDTPARAVPPPRPSLLRSMRDGFVYSLRHQPLRTLTFANFVFGLISASLAILLPEVAHDVLGREAFSASALVAGIIPGMIVTSFWLASRPAIRGRGRMMLIGLFAVVPMLVISGLSDNYWLTLANVLFWGAPMGFMATLLRQLTQEVTSREMMGRVMSVVHLFSRGTLPIASLGLLFLVKVVPAQDALVLVGLGVLVISTLIALTPSVRRL